MMMIKSVAELNDQFTCKFVLISNDVWMIQLFHDLNLLVDILLEEGFFLDMYFVDDFDSI